MAIEDLIRTMMQEFREIVKTETVVGEPVVAGDVIIVPVSKISFGFGAGGGKGSQKDGGTGTGGGGSVQPVAFILIQKGKAQLVPLEEKGMTVGELLKYAPDVIKKFKEFKEKRAEKKGAGEEKAKEESAKNDDVVSE